MYKQTNRRHWRCWHGQSMDRATEATDVLGVLLQGQDEGSGGGWGCLDPHVVEHRLLLPSPVLGGVSAMLSSVSDLVSNPPDLETSRGSIPGVEVGLWEVSLCFAACLTPPSTATCGLLPGPSWLLGASTVGIPSFAPRHWLLCCLPSFTEQACHLRA